MCWGCAERAIPYDVTIDWGLCVVHVHSPTCVTVVSGLCYKGTIQQAIVVLRPYIVRRITRKIRSLPPSPKRKLSSRIGIVRRGKEGGMYYCMKYSGWSGPGVSFSNLLASSCIVSLILSIAADSFWSCGHCIDGKQERMKNIYIVNSQSIATR